MADRDDFLTEMGLGETDFNSLVNLDQQDDKDKNKSETTPTNQDDEGASGMQSPTKDDEPKAEQIQEDPNKDQKGDGTEGGEGSEGEGKTDADEKWKEVIPEKFHRKTQKESVKAMVDAYEAAEKKITTTSQQMSDLKKAKEAAALAEASQPIVEQVKEDVNYQDVFTNPEQVITAAINKALGMYDEKRIKAENERRAKEVILKFRSEHPDFDTLLPEMKRIAEKHPEYKSPVYLSIVYEEAKANRKTERIKELEEATGIPVEQIRKLVEAQDAKEKDLIEQGKQAKLNELEKKKAASGVLADSSGSGDASAKDQDQKSKEKPKEEPEFQEMLDARAQNAPDADKLKELHDLGVI